MRVTLRRFLDLAGLALFLAWLVLIVAVCGQGPADAAGGNLLGELGHQLVQSLGRQFGLAAPLFLAAWLVGVLALWCEGRSGSWLARWLGWWLLVPGIALALELVRSAGSHDWASGGVLGSLLHQALSAHLPPWGVLLAAWGLVIVGLGLAGDVWWPVMARLLVRTARTVWWWYVARRVAAAEASLAARQRAAEAARIAAGSIPIRHSMERPAESELKPIAAADSEEAASLTDTQEDLPPPAAPEYKLPPLDLLEDPEPFPVEAHEQQLRERAVRLEKVFLDFGLTVRVVGINTGPVVTMFEIALETGVRLSKVTVLADDLALNLKVPSVRVVAPLPGKDTVGIEVPNELRATVKLKEIMLNAGPRLAKSKIPLFLGKDTEGRPLIYDLADMPHLLIAGRTGTGKSVCMNAIILSILMTRRPNQVKMIMIDPKMLEMSEYGKVPHLMHPVVKDMKKAEAILSWAVDKMEERYDLLSRARVRSIAAYNELEPEEIYRRLKPADDEEKARIPEHMPYIVIFVDEMNDLMMMMKKEVEGHIIRLAQKSRAAGIHLVVATQKPTVDVITGLIKSNLPARICFQVSSRTDSRVVLDEMGAEKLLGRGDMLFLQPGTSTIVRAQGTYAGDADIAKVVDFLECEPAYARELLQVPNGSKKNRMEELRARDDMYEAAVEVIVREQRGSVSLLQRALGIGYGRAARLVDFMAEDGIVGQYNGSNAREVLLTLEDWEAMKAKETEDATA
ncbi:MAG TPA: DNA translocase FtsK [Gemmatales bacterium]|nr:DNA translocase FtsK [Gemmatales bacterium]